MMRVDTLQGAYPKVLVDRDASPGNISSNAILVTSPNGNEKLDIVHPIMYEQHLDAVGTTMDLSPITTREMLFPSQPGTPSPDISQMSYRSVTPPPNWKELNIQEDKQSPERMFTRYGAITPPPG